MKKLLFFSLVICLCQYLHSQTLSERTAKKYFEKGKFNAVRIDSEGYKNTNEPLILEFFFKVKKKEYHVDADVFYKNLIPDADYYSLTNEGKVKINAKYLSQDSITLSFSLKEQPEIKCSAVIDLDQKGELCIDYSGSQGENGMEPEASSKENGAPGFKGEKGGDGMNGHDISVNVLDYDNELLEVVVDDMSTGNYQSYYVRKGASSVRILSNGGHGGIGGDGSTGEKGRVYHSTMYVDGNPVGGCYPGGPGGVGGDGGNGGNCGNITVSFTKETSVYSDLFSYEQLPGEGGVGGKQGRQGRYGDFTTNQGGKCLVQGNYTEYKPKPSKDGKPGECYGLLKIEIEE